MIQIFSSLLSIAYIIRVSKHISLRTSWYISPVIIFPFLTSIYQRTFISFIFKPEIDKFSLDGLNNLIEQWFNGNPTSLFLIGLLFFAEKVTLPSLSLSVLLELLLIFIGSTIFLLKMFGFINGFPIIFGLLIALIIHFLKKNREIPIAIMNYFSQMNSYRNFKINIYNHKFKDNKKVIRFLSGTLYLFFIVLNTGNLVDINVISIGHIFRMIFFIVVFIFLLFKLNTVNKKIFINYIPILILYSSISLTSFFNYNLVNLTSHKFNLNCITSIAFLPLLEYLYVLFYKFKSKIKSNLISSKFQKLIIISKVIIYILIFCYASYVLTSI